MKGIKRGSCLTAAFATSFSVFMLFASPVRAVDNDGYFQLEGDICGGGSRTAGATNCVDNAGPPPPVIQPGGQDDWDTILTCSDVLGHCVPNTPPGNATETPAFIFESTNLVFTGGGSKDQLDIPKWNWKLGSTPDKDSIVEAFATVYRPTTGLRAGHKLIYFGANRFAVDGDAQIGFWFFQNNVTRNANGGFDGVHKPGDVLILSNFVKGGGQSNIQVFVVQSVDSKNNVTFGSPLGANNTNGNKVCLGLPNPNNNNLPDTACAATNGAPSTALDPNFTGKGFNQGMYDVVGFFEGGIDLHDAAIATGIPGLDTECFGSFMVETRSSQSITAVLKDFALGPFEGCSATAKTEIHLGTDSASPPDVQGTTVPEKSTIHDKLILTASLGSPAVAGTATFKFYSTADCTGTVTATDGPFSLAATNPQTNPATSSVESSSHGPLSAGNYSFQAAYNGDDPNYPDKITSACETITVSSPGVGITKSCTAAYSGSVVTVSFSGTVTNTGSEDLHGVSITDSPASGNITQPSGGLLAKGGTFDYAGSYTTSWPSGGGTKATFTDTARVDALGVNNGAVSGTAPASCDITIAPSITVSKTCTNVLVLDSGKLVVKASFSGTVTNSGDTPLTLSSISDSPTATITGCSAGMALAAGASCNYAGSYFPTSLTGGTVTDENGKSGNGTASDTMSVSATVVLTGGTVSQTNDATCNLCPLPAGGAP
jgi:hypothetical protein